MFSILIYVRKKPRIRELTHRFVLTNDGFHCFNKRLDIAVATEFTNKSTV